MQTQETQWETKKNNSARHIELQTKKEMQRKEHKKKNRP